MMTLVDHLLQNRTPLEHELFWMKVAEATQAERTPEWFRDQYLTTPQPRPE